MLSLRLNILEDEIKLKSDYNQKKIHLYLQFWNLYQNLDHWIEPE